MDGSAPAAPETAFGPPGENGRLGIIQPAPGLMLEAEWMRAVPPGIAFPVTRLPLHGGTEADYAGMADGAPAAAAILANAAADVIGYACGIGSLYRGPEAERLLMQRLGDAAGGRPVIGMAEAAMTEIRRLGARRITLLTPYPNPVNALVRAYAEACGIEVAGIFSLPVRSAVEAGGLAPDQTMQAAADAAAAFPADLIWIPCSNVRAIDLSRAIQQRIGCPCLSSNQALLAAMLARLSAGRAATP